MVQYPDLVREAVKKGKFGILLLTCTLLAPHLVRAQQPGRADSCYAYVENVARLYNREDRTDPDVMTSIATVAQSGLECYDYEPNTQTVWLLNNRANALEHLGRYEEVQALTDLFFERFANAADDEHLGRFNLWRLLLYLYDGDFESAAVAYLEARRYADVLPLAQQAGLRNNGAVLAFRRERFEEAEREATAGIALLDSTAKTRDEALELAKLLQNRGHARLERYEEGGAVFLLDQARRDLQASIRLRDSLSITERQAEVYVTLGEIHHGLGDGSAGRGYMGIGLRMARQGGSARGEIFALWRMGRISRRGGMPALAHGQLQEALRLSQESAIGEFELFIELELGRLYEDGEAWKRAEALYQAVAEAPDETRYRSRLYDEAKARDEAERRGIAARMHLVEAETSWLRLALFGAALVILLVSGAALAWRLRFVRLRRRFAMLKNGTPEDDDLFDRRLRYAYRVIMRPADVLRALGDTGSSALLVAGLENNAQLFVCLCSLERRVDGRGVAPKSMERFLRDHFSKQGWDWPKSPEEWMEHFREHPMF